MDTIRYDTRCYFNMRSKADMSQFNLPHGTVEKVRPWCGQPSDRGRLKSSTEACRVNGSWLTDSVYAVVHRWWWWWW